MRLRSFLPFGKADRLGGGAEALEHISPVINDLKKRLTEDAPSPARLADTPGINVLGVEWGAVATNVIDKALSHNESLAVELPIETGIDRVLARSGLYFALSRQPTLDWTQFDEGQSAALKSWAVDWRPADVRQPLFQIGLSDSAFESNSPERELVAFLSADRVPRSDAMADQSVVVFPWLRDMVRHHERLGVETREALLEETAIAAQELLDNVRLHANLDSSGLCYVAYSITGQANADDLELHLTVLDTGDGIPATAQHHYVVAPPPEKIVQAALAGELRKRDRGRGLNRLAHLAERRGGRLFIATSADSGGAVVAECVQTVHAHVRRVDDLDLKGTVAVLTLPLCDQPPH